MKKNSIYLIALIVAMFVDSERTPGVWNGSEEQTSGEYKIVYVAENGNSGRTLRSMDVEGKRYEGFKIPKLPGRYFNGLVASVDGKRVAFMRDIEGIDSYSLWRMNSDGTDLKRLTPKGKRALAPSISADGSMLAFTRKAGGVWEIFTIDYDGGSLKKVTSFRDKGKRPRWGPATAWSPDGGILAYSVSFGGNDDYEIYMMDANGENVKQLTSDNNQDRYPEFSPDGKFLGYNSVRNQKTRETFVLDLKSGKAKSLGNSASGFGFAWSPDSRKIVYCGPDSDGSDIYLMNADGTNQVRLTTSSDLDLSPAWVYFK